MNKVPGAKSVNRVKSGFLVNRVSQAAKVCAVNAVLSANEVTTVLQVGQVFLVKKDHAVYCEETLDNQVLKAKLGWKVHLGLEVTTVVVENQTSKGQSVETVLKGSVVNAVIQVCQLKWVQWESGVSQERQVKMVKTVGLVTVGLQVEEVFRVNLAVEVGQDHVDR